MAQRMERHTVALDAELLADIREEVGPHGVSAFLNEAARAWLQRRRILRLLEEMDEECGPVPPEITAEIAADAEQIFGHR